MLKKDMTGMVHFKLIRPVHFKLIQVVHPFRCYQVTQSNHLSADSNWPPIWSGKIGAC